MSSRFVLKFKLRGRPNRDRSDKVVERDEVVLGSRPLADIYVPDRLVPQEALAFRFDGMQLSLDVRARLAGVFVDGRPVDGSGPIRAGAVVQIGHALVETAVDVAKGECTLTTNEQHLAGVVDSIVMKSKPARAFALVDPGPQEHRWGKNKVMGRANWFAGFIGLLVLAAFPFAKDSEAMTRGELFHAHAIGAKDGPKDCAACHAPFASRYDPKCATCHEGLDRMKTHPYERAADLSCSECHAEHVGAAVDIVPPMTPTASGWPKTCVRCHDGPHPEGELLAAAAAKSKTRLRDARGDAFARQLLVDGFSHEDHRVAKRGVSAVPGGPPKKGEVPVACAECHQLLPRGETNPAIPTGEFAGVQYAKCLECHADWRVTVHGRDEGGKACLACHAPDKAAAFDDAFFGTAAVSSGLRTIALPDTASKWVLKPRAHDFQKEECLKCHVLERAAPDHRMSLGEKVFRHDHHLRTVTPDKGGEIAFAQDCLACHKSLAGSDSLASAAIVDTTSCAKCHVDSEPVPVKATGATRQVVDIVHRVHTVDAASLSRSALRYASRDSLAKGCLSCHEPVAGAAPMTFREGAKDCKACHTGHENLGEGKCVLCHVDRTPGVNRELNGRLEFRFNEPGVFNPAKATKKTTAAQPRFVHTSPGHAGRECAECHRAETVDAARRVLDVAWPAFDEDACVKCHVQTRYHR
jgi:hypothetical protein